MEIFINGEHTAYRLEHERTLLDVIHSLEQSIRDFDGVISSLLVNNKSISFDDGSLVSVNIEDIKTIEVEVKPHEQHRAQQVEYAREYVDTLERIVRTHAGGKNCAADYNVHKEDIKIISDILDTLTPHCISSASVMSAHTSEQNQNSEPALRAANYTPMRFLFLYACELMGLTASDPYAPLHYGALSSKTMHMVLLYFDLCRLYFSDDSRMQSLTAVANHCMTAFIPHMRDISQLLISGDEELSMQYFIAAVDFIALWLFLIGMPEKNNSREDSINATDAAAVHSHKNAQADFFIKMNGYIEDVSNALEARDFVAVSDIIEYEIIRATEAHIAQQIASS